MVGPIFLNVWQQMQLINDEVWTATEINQAQEQEPGAGAGRPQEATEARRAIPGVPMQRGVFTEGKATQEQEQDQEQE